VAGTWSLLMSRWPPSMGEVGSVSVATGSSSGESWPSVGTPHCRVSTPKFQDLLRFGPLGLVCGLGVVGGAPWKTPALALLDAGEGGEAHDGRVLKVVARSRRRHRQRQSQQPNAKWKMDHGRVAACSGNAPPTQHASPRGQGGKGGGRVVCSAQTVPVRTQYDERRRRDPGRGKTGGEGRRKNNPVSGDPCEGRGTGMGTGDGGRARWWRRHKTLGPLARQASHRRWPAPPSSPRSHPPPACQPGSQ
jgi:hypothetical protein